MERTSTGHAAKGNKFITFQGNYSQLQINIDKICPLQTTYIKENGTALPIWRTDKHAELSK